MRPVPCPITGYGKLTMKCVYCRRAIKGGNCQLSPDGFAHKKCCDERGIKPFEPAPTTPKEPKNE